MSLSQDPSQTDKPTILVVDDEAGPRDALKVILRPFFNVQSADCARDALRLLQEHHIDLITLDQKLPDRQGLDLLQDIKQLYRDIEVIIITGYGSLKSAMDGIRHGAAGYLLKPFNVTELITLLLEAKEERQLLRMRQQLGKLDLLILDELGYVPASKAGAELLFDIIATAYERNSLIVTTNLPFENWTEVLGSERLTGAALDRLTHRCQILETKGESYRLQDAKRRRRATG